VSKSGEPPPELLELEELAPPAPEDVDDALELELIEEPEELDALELELIEEPEELDALELELIEEPEELDVLELIEEPELVAFDEPELDVVELDAPPLPPDPVECEPSQEDAPIAARAKIKGVTA
jgi:hypothetical protein